MSGNNIFDVSSEGPQISSDHDANDIIGNAGHADWIVIPVSRLAPEFFQLRTRLAGDFCQKFVTYGLRVAIIGDITRFEDASQALRDFVRESNRGHHIWFLPNRATFEHLLDKTQVGGIRFNQ